LRRFIEIARKPVVLHGSAYAFLVGIHLAMAFCMRYPTVFYDECVYLGFARYFAGVSHVPNLTGGAYGHFGYALLLAPAFWVSPVFYHQFQAALFINAILISASYFGLYYLLSRLTDLPPRASAAVAFTTCLYPSFLRFSNHAITENAFIPAYLLAVVCLLRLVERPGFARAILAGCAAGMTYTIHSRGLAVVVGAALLLTALAARRRLPWRYVAAALLVLSCVYAATNRESVHLQALGYHGGGLTQVGALTAYFKTPAGFRAFLMVLVGELVYLLQATYCLYFAGIAYMVALAWKSSGGAGRTARMAISVFLLAVWVEIDVGAAVFIAPQDIYHRSDHLLIGRYTEGVVAVLIAFSLALVWRAASDSRVRRMFGVGMVAGATVLVIGTVIVSPLAPFLNVNINSLSNLPIIWLSGGRSLLRATLLALMGAGAVAAVLWLKRRWAVVLVASLFLGGGAYIFKKVTSQRMTPPGAHSSTLISALRATQAVAIDYDMSAWHGFCYSSYQLLLPQTYFSQFDSARGETPKAAVVIASESWKDAARLGYAYVNREPVPDQALWVSPPALAERLAGEQAYIAREVGSDVVPRVRTTGVSYQEYDASGRFRWTNGRAIIRVPLRPGETAGSLAIDVDSPRETAVSISADGVRLLAFRMAPGRMSKTIPLPAPLTGLTEVGIDSGTFPSSIPPERVLGIQIRSVKLLP
jgi:hypothetical protein